MADWGLASGFRAESFGTNNAGTSNSETPVTSNATANTKGSWAQLAGSTTFDAAMLMLNISTQFGDTNYLIDIGIGGAGSEQIIIPDLAVALNNGTAVSVSIPIAVPAGSRIAARCQDDFGGSTAYLSGILYSASFLNMPPFHTVTAYGAVTGTSSGTIADAGATANTKGAWAQLTASTSQAHSGLLVAAVRPVLSTVITANYSQLADIGIGGAGSEQILIPNLFSFASRSSQPSFKGLVSPGVFHLPPCDIPPGVRLAVRQQSTTTNASDRQGAYVVYGLS
ncbi:MAG: hypothetical protein ACRDSH_16405 [Pseudonocardiaceae bacterium]